MTDRYPAFSIVIPLYNTERYIAEALESVLAQTFRDFEVIVVNDASTDDGPRIVEQYMERDTRIRMVTQENRGLAGARNTGIRHAKARYIALLDADDAFFPEKLERHFEHMETNSSVGVSYAPSALIDDDSKPLGLHQTPKLTNIDADHIFCRNPVGNGSAAVLRTSMLDEVRFNVEATEGARDCWFDESFLQSEDIEMWCRIAMSTEWMFEGIEPALTRYRVSTGGLSANVDKQFATWLKFRDKLYESSPSLIQRVGKKAEAYQRRYLARRSAISGDGIVALKLMRQSLGLHPQIFLEEPQRTCMTIGFSIVAYLLPRRFFEGFKTLVFRPM